VFNEGSLGAIHASNVLHFLSTSELELGIDLIFRWLASAGKVFVLVNSPYIQNFKNFIPAFEERKRTGTKWPGWVEDVNQYSSHESLKYLPKAIHFFDASILSKAFESRGFKIEVAREFSREGLPNWLRYDGRENVLLVAHK
jgi:hypothetical protein